MTERLGQSSFNTSQSMERTPGVAGSGRRRDDDQTGMAGNRLRNAAVVASALLAPLALTGCGETAEAEQLREERHARVVADKERCFADHAGNDDRRECVDGAELIRSLGDRRRYTLKHFTDMVESLDNEGVVYGPSTASIHDKEKYEFDNEGSYTTAGIRDDMEWAALGAIEWGVNYGNTTKLDEVDAVLDSFDEKGAVKGSEVRAAVERALAGGHELDLTPFSGKSSKELTPASEVPEEK